MCNYYVNFEDISQRFNTDVKNIKEILEFKDEKFNDFLDLNLMRIKNDTVSISHDARLFIRNIAMEFDPLLNSKIGTYSKTI